jgi:predicted nucleic acid-binding protein
VKIVLDTNVLVSGIFWTGVPFKILSRRINDQFELLLSDFVTVKKRFKLSHDPDDNKFIECAVSGNAYFTVSGDSHLLILKSILNTEVITPSLFLKKISTE